MKHNIIKTSLVATMLLTSGSYAAQIIGADVGGTDPYAEWEANTQFGFGGLNLENVTVNMLTGEGNVPIVGTFDPNTGTYPTMSLGDTFESDVFNSGDDKTDRSTRMGYLKQKLWPLSEPTGLKVINNDIGVSNGKPVNCIMASSYLLEENLDTAAPKPVLCSSPAGSNKRFQLVLNENVVADTNPGEFGKSVDLVFNIDSGTDEGDHRYQVFQKVSNYTGMRLDGFTMEVLDENGQPNSALTLSLGIGEERDKDGILTGGDLWPEYEFAFYPPGLWGDGLKEHLPPGWFDIKPSGYEVSGHGTNKLTSGARLDGNYVELFGNWQPEKWVPLGMHEVINPLEEPVLIAYWGTTPSETFNDAPAWHYGMDHDLSNGDQSWTIPSEQELSKWAANPEKYVVDAIEDIPNLSLNYIVNVGEGITNKFIIRVTPKVSVDQTAPSYIADDDISYILPPDIVDPIDPIDPVEPPISSGGGGGCTYNPNQNFDMTFLLLMALGLVYPFRRKFLK